MQRVDQQLFVQHRQNAAPKLIVPGGGVVFRDFIHGDDRAGFVRRTPQQIVAGDAVIIGGPYHEIQAAFPRPAFD